MVNTFKVLLAIGSTASLLGGALAISGSAIWFFPGLSACGELGTNFFVALSSAYYANGGACGRNVRVDYQGRSVVVRVTDLCTGCGPSDIDLSPAALQQLTGQVSSQDRIQVDWDFI